MMLADIAATRSTCDRGPTNPFRRHRGTGCVLVAIDGRQLSTGYNGSSAGDPHCDDIGHQMQNGGCQRTIHAEQNAIDSAAFDLTGSACYTVLSPCRSCCEALISVGVKKLVYGYEYRGGLPSNISTIPEVLHLQIRADP